MIRKGPGMGRLLVHLGYSKAFDMVDHLYANAVLVGRGFGPWLLWLDTYYLWWHLVQVNGYMS